MKRLPIIAFGLTLGFLLFSSNVGLGMVSSTLYIYTDDDYEHPADLAPTDEHGFFEAVLNQLVYIQIAGITEFESGDLVQVKISYNGYVKTWTNVEVHILTTGGGQGTLGVGDASAPLGWQVGWFDGGVFVEIPYCETLTVHYKDATGTGPEYVAGGTIKSVGHLHVIPENPLGTIGPLMASLVGIIAFALVKKRTAIINLR